MTGWGSLSAPADPLAAIGGGVHLLRGRGREREGMRKWRGKGKR